MSNLDLFKLQNSIAAQINRAKCNFKKTAKDRITLSYVRTRLQLLEQNWKEFTENHRQKVLELESETLQKSSYIVNEVFELTEELYIEYNCLLNDVLAKFELSNVINKPVESQRAECVEAKLPKIQIPKFSGNYAEWASFHDLFTSLVHSNNKIDNVQKLHYLKSSVTGEAEQLLRHLSVTADNYSICWDQLKGRYNNKKYLADSFLKTLVNQKPVTTESSSALKLLLDITRECLHGISILGVDIKSWDILIIYLIKQKLDPESRKGWEQKVTESPQELPTMTMFEEFLTNRFRCMEFIDAPKSSKQKVTHVATTTLNSCSFCSESHKICNCRIFAKQSIDARREFAKSNHLCFNCLNTDHSVFQCNSSTRCRLCKKKHHTLLHPKNSNLLPESGQINQSVNRNVAAAVTASTSSSQTHGHSSDVPTITSLNLNTSGQVLLATALVMVSSRNNKRTEVLRSLLDQGSQASFVTESAVQILGLRKTPEKSVVCGLGGDRDSTISSKSTVLLRIQSRLNPKFTVFVKAHVLTKLTCLLPSSSLSTAQGLPVLSSFELADPSFGTPNKIDLLLGAEVYSQILLKGLIKGPSSSVIAQNTKLGWILSGKIHTPDHFNQNDKRNIVSMHLTAAESNNLLKKFWEMESEPPSYDSKHLTLEEQRCEEFFSATTLRDESGRYVVRLPFSTEDPLCKYGNLNEIARKRFYLFERRLKRDPSLKEEYSKVSNEYLRLGHMEVVSNPAESNAVYLPHHAVIGLDKTTSKIRVVFDGSCKDNNGASLNSDLMRGPTLQPELRHLIMRWRRLFDPLGWFTVVIATAKIFIQRLWLSGIEWDDPLPSSLLQDWVRFRNDLDCLADFRIPRWIRTRQDDKILELHGFSDASNLAYAAVVYMRVIDSEGKVHVSILTSKTRVAPIKQVSITRLELCGSVLLAKLMKEVSETLDIPKNHLHAYTDSTIVLAWLSSHPSRWKTFVANRTSEILTFMDGSQWSHVASKDNPADCASRGEQPSESVTNELWTSHDGSTPSY